MHTHTRVHTRALLAAEPRAPYNHTPCTLQMLYVPDTPSTPCGDTRVEWPRNIADADTERGGTDAAVAPPTVVVDVVDVACSVRDHHKYWFFQYSSRSSVDAIVVSGGSPGGSTARGWYVTPGLRSGDCKGVPSVSCAGRCCHTARPKTGRSTTGCPTVGCGCHSMGVSTSARTGDTPRIVHRLRSCAACSG